MASKKRPTNHEEKELDSYYHSIAGKKAAKKGKSQTSNILIVSICAVLLLGIILGVWFLFSDNWFTMPDVTVAGVNMSGMTKQEAKDLLRQMITDKYGTQTMTITVMDMTMELPASEAQVAINVHKAINEAYRNSGEFDISPYITLNDTAMQHILDAFASEFNKDLEPTVYTVDGTVPDLGNGDQVSGQILTLALGKPQMGLAKEDLLADILAGYSRGEFQVESQCKLIFPEMLSSDELYEKFLTPAVDATMDDKFTITPETYGYSIDPDLAAQLLQDAQYGDTLQIPFAKVNPAVTEEDILSTLFQDILGQCSTPYSGSDTNNRNTNLGLACEKIDGLILLPGETFSYNQTLGERTKENGWKPAGTYVNGLTVDTYGGGICQGSTTLYNCVLQADLKITECYPHGYISSYVEPGLDASVNWPTADFKFVNTTDYPIKIEAYRREGKMTMRLYGTDTKNYYVKMSYRILGTTAYKTVYEEVDPDNNPKNYKDGQELVSPYTGYRVATYKNRYDKETDELIETKLERDFTYSTRDRVLVKLVKPGEKEETDKEGEASGTEGSGGENNGGSGGSGATEPTPTIDE